MVFQVSRLLKAIDRRAPFAAAVAWDAVGLQNRRPATADRTGGGRARNHHRRRRTPLRRRVRHGGHLPPVAVSAFDGGSGPARTATPGDGPVETGGERHRRSHQLGRGARRMLRRLSRNLGRQPRRMVRPNGDRRGGGLAGPGGDVPGKRRPVAFPGRGKTGFLAPPGRHERAAAEGAPGRGWWRSCPVPAALS